MKKWNAPVVAELDVKNTENGLPWFHKEVTYDGIILDHWNTNGEVVTEEGNTGDGGDGNLGQFGSGTTATS